MQRRLLLALMILGAATASVGAGAGATPPGAPAEIFVNFIPDAPGVKPNGYSPVQMAELDFISTGQMRLVSSGGNQWLRADSGSVELVFARRTNRVEFFFGGDVNPSTLTIVPKDNATVLPAVTYNPNNNNSIDQRVVYQNDDLFNRLVIGLPGNQLKIDNLIVDPLCTWVGTNGRNVKVGTPGDDVLCARAGNDVISGIGGNDRIVAGSGDDAVRGGTGNDDLFGGPGTDSVNGETGNDHCDGGAGNGDAWVNCDFVTGVP